MGMQFEYDEEGGTFFYFLLSFWSLVLIPATYYLWPRTQSPGNVVKLEPPYGAHRGQSNSTCWQSPPLFCSNRYGGGMAKCKIGLTPFEVVNLVLGLEMCM